MKKFQFMCPFFIQKAFKMKFKYSYILHCSCMIYAGAWSLHRMWYILHRTWCLLSYWKQSALAYLWKADAVIYARVIYTCWTKQILLSMGKQVTTQICMSNWILSCVKKWKSWWRNIRSKNCQRICIIWKEKNECDM